MGQAFTKSLMLIIYLLLPAIISVHEYGLFSYALSLCFIFSQPLTEFGLDPVVTKHISRGSDYIIKDAFILRAKTSVIGFMALLISAYVLNVEFDIVIILFFYVFFFSFSRMVFAYLRGKEMFGYESIILPLFRVCIIVLILFFSKMLLIDNRYTGAIPFSVSSFILFIISITILIKVHHSKTDSTAKKNDMDVNLCVGVGYNMPLLRSLSRFGCR